MAANDTNGQLRHIYTLITDRNYQEARPLLREYLIANPNDADAYYLASFLTNDPARKIQACEKALQLNPQHRAARTLMDSLHAAQSPTPIETTPQSAPPLQQTSSPADNQAPTPEQEVANPPGSVQKSKQNVAQSRLVIALGAALIVALVVVAALAATLIAHSTAPTPTQVIMVVTAVPSPTTANVLPPTWTPVPTQQPTPTVPSTSTPQNSVALFEPTDVPALTAPAAFSISTLSDPITPISYSVVDAAYSASLDRIIIVSDKPSPALHIYDPETGRDQEVVLSKTPTCLGLSADGKFAAVGHDALVSYVDLQQAKVVKTLDLTAEAYSLVLASNGWIYVMPSRDQWVYFHALEIATNREEQPKIAHGNSLVYAGGKLVLAADGMSFFYVQRNLSPAHMYREILSSDGTISDSLDWPYHGDYYPCDNIWLTADNKRIIGGCGTVFRQSTDPKQDMTYNGTLQGLAVVYSAAHSIAAAQVIAVGQRTTQGSFAGIQQNQRSSANLFFFDYASLAMTAQVQFPTFANGEQSAGRFIFTNAAGTRFYALLETAQLTPGNAPTKPAQFDNIQVGILAADVPGAPPPASATATIVGAATVIANSPTVPPATVTPVPPSPITMFNYRIAQAAYSKSLKRLILTTADTPPALHLYDPVTRADSTINLPKPPSALSVSPDGKFALVGHDALVSYIDLTAGKIANTYDVAFPVAYVTAAGNGWIYAAAQQSQPFGQTTVAIELSSGQQQPGFSGTGQITPDGQTAYTSDLQHVDLSQGTPKPIPAQGTQTNGVSVCGPIWLAEDGKRIFTACGAVLRASTDPKQDLSYNGSLDRLNHVSAVADSAVSGRILAIGQSTNPDALGDDKLIIYNYEWLTTDKIVQLPKFTSAAGSFTGHGRYVFFNPDGTEYYVIMQADDKSGLLNDFGVVTMTLGNVTLTPTNPALSSPATQAPTAAADAPQSPVQMLDFSVAFADYSKALDRIIFASADPNALVIYNPTDGQKTTIPLVRTPLSLAIAPDGLYAAVGHDALITFIDLKAAKVLKTYDVPFRASNVAVALNGWMYAFPNSESSMSVNMINLKTGEVTTKLAQYIYSGSVTMYPDGTRMYYGQTGLSPSTLYRIDIGADGKISGGAQWPYWGQYSPCGQVWISQDGKRLFTACGTVFRSSSDAKQDMTYNGQITQNLFGAVYGLTYLWIAHAPQAKLIYALPNVDKARQYAQDQANYPKQKLLIFDYDSLQYLAAVDLPKMSAGNRLVDGQGGYIFTNSKDDHYYVIMEADKGAGLLNNFGVWSDTIVRPVAQ